MDIGIVDDEVDDTHLCIKCKSTIVGLHNYVKHRKSHCLKSEPSRSVKEQQLKDGTTDPYLGADVFFSSLELQSSAKKASVSNSYKGVLTRKATAAILATNNAEWIEGPEVKLIPWTSKSIDHLNKKDDHQYSLLDAYNRDDEFKETSESSEEDVDEAFDRPPVGHTGGKWKPRSPWHQPHHDWEEEEHTGGKWKPEDCAKTVKPNHYYDSIISKLSREHQEDDDDLHPPPGHTKGKWIPGENLPTKYILKPEKNVQSDFWCGPCNRKLSSKIVYDRHMTSNLHRNRTKYEKELERNLDPTLSKRIIKPSIYLNESLYPKTKKATRTIENNSIKKRSRKPLYVKCSTCKLRVKSHLFGKHLISHYHCRKADSDCAKSSELILDNILSIVKQSPYQCQICRFYTNFEESFLQHWLSDNHKEKANLSNGLYWCSTCKYETECIDKMFDHLISHQHKQVIAVINRSFPIIIRKRVVIKCNSCSKEFRYNIELRRHMRTECVVTQNTASDDYQNRVICEFCGTYCRSKIALQRHKLNVHKINFYFCSVCDQTFNDRTSARQHRNSAKHKIKVSKNLQKEEIRICNYCHEQFENVMELKLHLKNSHPHEKHSCMKCGMQFDLPQEVSRHVRSNACSLLEQNESYSLHCEICTFGTDSGAELLFHNLLHNEPVESSGVYQCPLCEKTFSKQSLRCHLRRHTGEFPYKCSQCSASYTRKNGLLEHIATKHGTKIKSTMKTDTFSCSICGANFTRKFTLQQHLHTHRTTVEHYSKQSEDENYKSINLGTQKFICTVQEDCLYQARSAAELAIHIATHGEERPHRCTICDYASKTRPQLLKHLKIHNRQDKLFNCPHCNYSGRLESQLSKHILQHEKGRKRKYACPFCSFQSLTLENLRKHVLNTNKHVGKFLYNCELCPLQIQQGFNTAKEFRKHLVLCHADHFKKEREIITYVMEFLFYKKNKHPQETMCSTSAGDMNGPLKHNLKLSGIVTTSEFEADNMNLHINSNETILNQDFENVESNLVFEKVYNVDPKDVIILKLQ